MAATAFAYRSRTNSSSDSDSDDGDKECLDWKRASHKTKEEDLEKILIEPSPTDSPISPVVDQAVSLKRKRNNIWCDVLQDQMISETLVHCGIKNKPKGYGSRGEESYDYTLGKKYHKMDDELDNDMSGDDTSVAPIRNSMNSHRHGNFNKSKFVKLDDAGVTAAKKIIKVLGEQKHYLIYRVVKYIGIEKAMELLKMTEEIEDSGGMMIKTNTRRRTPGGVYFQLLKSDKDVEKSSVDKIFEGEMNSYEIKRLYDERKKMKKLAAKKKALLEELAKDMETQQEQQLEPIDEPVAMEEESELVKTDASPYSPKIAKSKDSDLEDGEIEG